MRTPRGKNQFSFNKLVAFVGRAVSLFLGADDKKGTPVNFCSVDDLRASLFKLQM